jgi:hypothetical protein
MKKSCTTFVLAVNLGLLCISVGAQEKLRNWEVVSRYRTPEGFLETRLIHMTETYRTVADFGSGPNATKMERYLFILSDQKTGERAAYQWQIAGNSVVPAATHTSPTVPSWANLEILSWDSGYVAYQSLSLHLHSLAEIKTVSEEEFQKLLTANGLH